MFLFTCLHGFNTGAGKFLIANTGHSLLAGIFTAASAHFHFFFPVFLLAVCLSALFN
jgi:hypothetical protein